MRQIFYRYGFILAIIFRLSCCFSIPLFASVSLCFLLGLGGRVGRWRAWAGTKQELAGTVVKEIVRLGLKADRERGDPSLGMGLTMADAKGLRRAAARHVDVTSVPLTTVSAAWPAGDAAEAATPGGGGMGLSPEEALFARVQAEVIKDDKVAMCVTGRARSTLDSLSRGVNGRSSRIAAVLLQYPSTLGHSFWSDNFFVVYVSQCTVCACLYM